jgi:transposase
VACGSRGFDAGKKINGRKRHLLTDTLGLLLDVLVTPASTTDRDAARILLPTARSRSRRLSKIWADGGYRGHLQDWAAQHLGLVLDVVLRHEDVQGFQVLPRRLVVERPAAVHLAGFGNCGAHPGSGLQPASSSLRMERGGLRRSLSR